MSHATSFRFLWVCIATLLIYYCPQFSVAGNNETDLLALQEIKARISNDPFGITSSWNDSFHFCEWSGVICGRRHERVVTLDLSSLKLEGTLSPFVGNLSFLRRLYLQNNSFVGTIPPEIGRLHKLQYLWLFNNSLGGRMPLNMSRCSNLVDLSVDNNKLVGEIPPWLGSLSNLWMLSLPNNHLTGGIPTSLGNLTSLYAIWIAKNHLRGIIPDIFGRLQKLTFISVYVNQLSGKIPPSIFNLSSLGTLDLGENILLQGRLPLDLGNLLPNLQFLSITNNQFSGPIPPSISNSSNLVNLQLDRNNLQGQVPSFAKSERLHFFTLYSNSLGIGQATDLDFVGSLANATKNLGIFDIKANNFEGNFPSIICNFSVLYILGLASNNIAGEIPTCIENLASLQWFDARQDQLYGPIPSSLGKLQKLGILQLDNNLLSGSIPPNIGNLTLLTKLTLSGNNLHSLIPLSLENCKYLLVLDLSRNNLTSGIPSQIFNILSLVGLDLSYNPLNSTLAPEIGELKNIVFFDVSSTMLFGEIPSTLGACTSLLYLYIGGNFFQGIIPSTFITLKGLQKLDLSQNNLSGEIPKYLAMLPLQMLNLSYNSLEGEVPVGGIFYNVTGLSVLGNKGLCGGMPQLNLPLCNSRKMPEKGLDHKRRSLIVAILSGFSGIILLITVVSLYVIFKKRRKENLHEVNDSLLILSYQSLLKATNGFSSENLIGSGGFGSVYKGVLDHDQNVVAVKVFNLEHRGAPRTFMAECQVLKNVRHRNLVKVITACSSVDNQGKDFKALVYEYMVNGSLEDWLHGKRSNNFEGTSNAARNLDLLQRLDIAVDVAFALEYLHHHCGVPIAHCDLKPNNVLLDDKMVARVGDFGLAKFLSQGIITYNTNLSSLIGVRGTIGYTPPEYGLGNELSTYGDVYSFGVLLLEIFTGKRPTDNMFRDGLTLHGFVKAALPQRMMEILDHSLHKDLSGDDSGNTKLLLDTLTSILEVALACSAEIPQDRLSMTSVTTKLSSMKSKLLGTHFQRQKKIPMK